MKPVTPITSLQHPVRTLLFAFVTWKALLLLIAICSPGPGYDTSTALSLSNDETKDQLPEPMRYMVHKLTRWDAIYYVTVANRGYLFEQEWAFGWGFTRFISLCTAGILRAGVPHYEGLEGIVAIFIAHINHLLSVLVLYRLTLALVSDSLGVAFVSAAFHIISPAGLFLSAPYAESSTAFLSFLGTLVFIRSQSTVEDGAVAKDGLVLLTGILFGIATTFRSNGIINGILLFMEAIRLLTILTKDFRYATVRRLIATGIGGLFVAFGFLLPQYIAYSQFCGDSTTSRAWCQKTLPSIYTFVQDYYWNCGPFRYWTVSNLPLFLLATPMFYVLAKSSIWALTNSPINGTNFTGSSKDSISKGKSQNTLEERSQVMNNLAVSQLLLTGLTLVTAHVQIISRISSSYPVWVWYLATTHNEKGSLANVFVSFMVMYGMIQAALFASFLPPA